MLADGGYQWFEENGALTRENGQKFWGFYHAETVLI